MKVTVIIPYKVNRGWLQDAINSVPKENVQLLVSQGEGNWPENFNKVLKLAMGDYIRYLHEDDMLTSNCINDSIRTLEWQGADFMHGDVYELDQESGRQWYWRSPKKFPTLNDMLEKNYMHSASLMYRREVFEKLSSFNETLNVMEEYEFNLRCLQAGMKLGYCGSPLAIYRRHREQKVRVISANEKSIEREMVKKQYR
jgi:GT2 family glycosyltransferase